MLQNNEIFGQIGRPKLASGSGAGGTVKSVRKTVCQIIFHSICATRSKRNEGKEMEKRKTSWGGGKKMLIRQVKGNSSRQSRGAAVGVASRTKYKYWENASKWKCDIYAFCELRSS